MTRPFAIDVGWAALLDPLGIDPNDLLRAAALPADLFRRERPALDPESFFRLWRTLMAMIDDPAPGLALGRSVPSDSFSPPLFAAFCSPDLKVAMQRLSVFKPLLGPLTLDVAANDDALSDTYAAEDGLHLPSEFVATELVFLVSLARLATRADIEPLRVEMTEPPPAGPYDAYFGVRVRKADRNRLVFSARDAARPFLSVNPAMYAVFQPELRMRLEEMTREAPLADRLRAALMAALPSGRTAIGDVAPRLGLSARSLQRKLGEAGTSYQAELIALRTRLATDYLRNTAHTSSEISYLLGYDDPNSFARAFHGWTGTTPEAMRRAALSGSAH
ncbi:AraC family transcriptional regulator ligand-binding domain-containing protein [Oricola indica]|uniref:AraC family transcriptional regulator n=1 Tax=Oricola indica TaxID=2872591 RepID=UPI003CCC3A75